MESKCFFYFAPPLLAWLRLSSLGLKMFENHRKSLIQHYCERKSYVYILSGQKLIKNVKNGSFWRVFRKAEACGQTVLPDILMPKLENSKCDIFGDFQTM